MTTNGTLIDDEFVEFVATHNFISLSYSIDGANKSQNENRVMKDGRPTYDIVIQNAKKLLSKTNVAVAVPVVTQNNMETLSDNLKTLLDIGFKKISFQFDLTANWEDKDLKVIRREFEKISKMYIEAMRAEKEFHLLGIDEKIRSYINDSMDVNDNCSVGMRGANVGTDGNIYPCMQFMYEPEYVIGNCESGIDKEKQLKVHQMLKHEMEECKDCSLQRRCNHTCSCINKAYTGEAKTTSPFTYEIERMMIEVADNIAETLYAEKNPVFIQKYYNVYYHEIERQINQRGE